MASLEQFAKRIRLRAKRMEVNVDQAVARAAIVINQTVVIATPVDTGRARANWQAEVGAPSVIETDDTDKSGRETIASNNAKIARRRSGQTIFLSNNLEYIGELNRGSSSQAPASFVEIAVAQGLAVLRRARIVK